MTRRSTFKSKIRARMAKTGERYAAARLALLKQVGHAPPLAGATLLPGYQPQRGVHADTALLASALRHAGVIDPATDAPFTEAKLFGLSGGIGFMYFLFVYKGHPPMVTFSCRSWTTPWPVIGKALEHAGIAHQRQETGGAATAAKQLRAALDAGHVAHLTGDYVSLPWSGVNPAWKGQMGRQLNVVGRKDDDYVVDTGALHTLDEATLADVRGAVKKEKHRLLTFEGGVAGAAPSDAVRAAVSHTVTTFREAPFKGYASNFGLAGLAKAAQLVGDPKGPKTWGRVFDSGPLAFRALYRTFECAMIELTPPAGGRGFYAEYLDEVASLRGLGKLAGCAEIARESAEGFQALADTAVQAGGKPLSKAVELTEAIDELRRTGTGDHVGERVAGLIAERDALAESLDLSAAERREVFAALGAGFGALHATEQRLNKGLEAAID